MADGSNVNLDEIAEPTVGDDLRAAREYFRKSREEIAEATRVRACYIAAIEEMRLEELPSRPFGLGYVRAYANCLGLSGDTAVARMKAAWPVDPELLKAPVGVQPAPRHGGVKIAAAAVAVVVACTAAYNVYQRMTSRPAAAAPKTAAPVAAKPGAISNIEVSAPLPPPADAGAPPRYVTPGLAEAQAASGDEPTGTSVILPAPAEPAPPPSFTPNGAVYGAKAQESEITLQAKKSASLVIRAADGQVVFAQQLHPGEAYRAPTADGLTLDVSDPLAFNVYHRGQIAAPLADSQTSLSRLAAAETPGRGKDT